MDTARRAIRALRAAAWAPTSEVACLPAPDPPGTDPVLGGVCAGIAERRGWRPGAVRLATVLLVLPALLYPVAWLVRTAGPAPAGGRGRANRQLFLAVAAGVLALFSAVQLIDFGLPEIRALLAGLFLGSSLLTLPRSALLTWRSMTVGVVAVLLLLWGAGATGVDVPFPVAVIVAYLPVLYAVAARHPRPVVVAVGAWTLVLVLPCYTLLFAAPPAAVVWTSAVLVGVLVAGDNMRVRREETGISRGTVRAHRPPRAPVPLWDGVLDAVWRPLPRPEVTLRLPRGPVRPLEGRLVAGVCRALAGGRSPRALTAVRALFAVPLWAVVGVPLYLLLWLLLPGERPPGEDPEERRDAVWARRSAAWFLLFGLGAATASTAAVQATGMLGLPVPVAVVSGLVTGMPIALLPRSPLLAWRFMAGGLLATLVAYALVGTSLPPSVPGGMSPTVLWPWPIAVLLALVPVLYLVALAYPGRTTVGVGAVTVVADILSACLFVAAPVAQALWISVAVVGVLAFGHNVRGRRAAQRDLAQESALRRRDRARQAVLEERSRIARELHDVVSHHMSMIAIQAEAAPYKYPDLSPAAAGTFHTIRDAAREALVEMRRVVGLLREEAEDAERAPQPGLSDIGDLVEGARQAGVPVRARVSGLSAEPSETVGLSVYRIVQESLSNAGRHAPGAPVRVTVEEDDGQIVVRVVNDAGGPGPRPAADVGGHGLVGMRERVAMLGGTLRAGPLPEGGFEVVARLPMDGGE
ncbi:histidine kinase [Marinactinospora thermotolerans]|uniref:histidine kinase n=1 Tax=Marinactinospora thermotolerans TaxID=531310 RepID=UPI0013566A07|nr:histidine kinase [Marinactinospora thermotolerans]